MASNNNIHRVPVELDPVRSAVSQPGDMRHNAHIKGGQRLIKRLVAAATISDNYRAEGSGQCHGFQSVNVSSSTGFNAVDRLTLAGLPHKLLLVRLNRHGAPYPMPPALLESYPPLHPTPLPQHGTLARYFSDRSPTNHSLWYHPQRPDEYRTDYPFSVDNFDCEQLVEDIEDYCGFHSQPLARWALWLACSVRTCTGDYLPLDHAQIKICRRVQSVDSLLEALNMVRVELQRHQRQHQEYQRQRQLQYQCQQPLYLPPNPATELLRQMKVYFVVGVPAAAQPPIPWNLFSLPYAGMHEARQVLGGFWNHQAPHWGLDSDEDGSECDCSRCQSDFGNEQWSQATDAGQEDPDSQSDDGSYSSGSRGPSSPDSLAALSDVEMIVLSDPDDIEGAPEWWEGAEEAGEEAGEEDDRDKGEEEHKEESKESTEEAAPPPPPPVSILESLDTNAAKGDPIEGDLHALLPEAQPPTEEQWRQCCTLLCLDPEAHKNAQARSVRVPGTDNMWVKPSQLWTAFWMLTSRTSRDLAGGVLADVMGTGKTYVCLLVCLLRAYIAFNRAEVEREWQLREHESRKGAGSHAAPKQHHPRDVAFPASGSSESLPCPCGNAAGIECFANPGGITRRIADSLSRGVALIQAPQTVLDNWVKTVKHVRLQHRYFEPIVFHSKMTKEDTVMAPAPRLKQKLAMEVRPRGSSGSSGSSGSDSLFPASWAPAVSEASYRFTPSIAKDSVPERFLFLASHAPDKLTEFFQVPVPVQRPASGASRERKTVYGCPVGIQLVDEFHKARDGAAVELARQHKHMMRDCGRDFDFWAITGTPMPARLTDLEAVAELVQRLPEWDDPASLHHGSRVCSLQELQAAYDRAVAEDGTPQQTADFRSRAERFFQGGRLIMRHTETSTFFGQRIFRLQDVVPQVVVHFTPAEFRAAVGAVAERVAKNVGEAMALRDSNAEANAAAAADADADADAPPNWAQLVRSSSLFNHMMDLEILATFPGAARLMLADPPAMDFGLAAIRAEVRQAENRDVTKVALFQQHLDTVIENSPHLAAILATLDEMDRDQQPRRMPPPSSANIAAASGASRPFPALPRKKDDARLKKLVILCPRMGEAVFVYLALCKLRPDANALFLHADLKLSERSALLRHFNRLDTPPASTSRVLVGTFRDAGTGNDLTVASYQILTGPLRLPSQQNQAFGRTNREGQTLRLHHRLLATDDSPVDRIVMVTQAGRCIASNPFSIDEPLRLKET